ncbi:MAG: ABC transporter substrate-binding protein [Thermotogota bacterium]
MRKLFFVFLLSILLLSTLGFARDTVLISISAEPSRLNPVTYQDTEADFVLSQIHDPLVELTESGDYTSDGAIIESYNLSEDGKVYTFKIKKGITFHNGEELNAEDVKFSYDSFLDETLGSPHRDYYSDIDEVVIIDDYTLEVRLKNRNVTFLTSARLRNKVLPKDYIEDVGWEGYEKHPIGSGPYEFVKHDPGQRIVLKRYDEYWQGKANIPNLEFRFFPEMTSAIMALQAKQIDFIAELPAEEFTSLKNNPVSGLGFGTYQKFEDHRVVFNRRPDSVFSDVRVRQAVNYAINRDEIISLTMGEMAVPATGRVPNFHEAYAPDAPAYEYNPEKAKELLAEAGYPDGFSTQIYAPSNYRERVLEVQQIQRQLSQVGIQAQVVAIEWGTYLDVTAEGEAPMFRERWAATSPSPFSFVESWHSESSWNSIFGTYENPEVDKLVDKIKVTVNPQERWELYREVQRIAMEDAVCVPLYWPIAGEAYNNEVNIPEYLWNVFKRPIYYVNEWSFN